MLDHDALVPESDERLDELPGFLITRTQGCGIKGFLPTSVIQGIPLLLTARCEPWASQCQEPKMRYKFLILRGGSQSGKSTLAKSLGDIFGLGKPFIQTVQDAEAADLKGFDRQQYGYILFDNINSMEFVLSQRALFQANCDVHQLAQSKTGI